MAATDDILGAVHVAIYGVLSGDITLTGKAAVYDHVPDSDATFPYVTVGEALPTKWDAFSKRGREVLATVHVWSRYHGYKEAESIVADLNRLLDRGALSLTGLNLVTCQYEDAHPMRDPDGVTRHIAVRYRLLAQEI